MPCPFQIFSQSNSLIQIVDINSHSEWQTVQIQISWLLQKPTDLDLHCLQNRVYPGSAGQGLRLLKVFILLTDLLIQLIKHGKETAEVIIIPRRIIEDKLSVALYKHSKTDFFLTIKTSNTSKSLNFSNSA